MSKITVVGLDPSLRNTGVAIGRYDLNTGELEICSLHLIKTEKSTNKQVRVTSDDLNRARKLAAEVDGYVGNAHAVFSEATFFSKNAKSAKAGGICIGLLAKLRQPLYEMQAQEVKVGSVGKKTASKAEMIAWANSKYPDANGWLYSGKRLIADNEHLADACAVLDVGVRGSQFQGVVALMRSTAQ